MKRKLRLIPKDNLDKAKRQGKERPEAESKEMRKERRKFKRSCSAQAPAAAGRSPQKKLLLLKAPAAEQVPCC